MPQRQPLCQCPACLLARLREARSPVRCIDTIIFPAHIVAEFDAPMTEAAP